MNYQQRSRCHKGKGRKKRRVKRGGYGQDQQCSKEKTEKYKKKVFFFVSAKLKVRSFHDVQTKLCSYLLCLITIIIRRPKTFINR